MDPSQSHDSYQQESEDQNNTNIESNNAVDTET